MLCSVVFLLVQSLMPANVMGITIKEEEELSREFLKVIEKRYELIRDPLITGYVNTVGKNILATMPPQPFTYHFYVVKQHVYNAFATPAGHIFINSGLLEALEDPLVHPLEDREEEFFFRREILVDGALPDIRAPRDISDPGRGVALLRKDGGGGPDEACTLVSPV